MDPVRAVKAKEKLLGIRNDINEAAMTGFRLDFGPVRTERGDLGERVADRAHAVRVAQRALQPLLVDPVALSGADNHEHSRPRVARLA